VTPSVALQDIRKLVEMSADLKNDTAQVLVAHRHSGRPKGSRSGAEAECAPDVVTFPTR
jgi:hypothetical protein